MLIGVSYGTAQSIAPCISRREQRKHISELQSEKDKYQQLLDHRRAHQGPQPPWQKAADLAEKLRVRILQTNFTPENPLSVTASFGVATSAAGGNFDDAFRQADEALYLAKSRGRNCVVAASEDQMHKVTGARKGTWALISGRFKLHSAGKAKES